MDLHFLTGIPHDVYEQKRLNAIVNPIVKEILAKHAEPASLPLEVVEVRKHIKRRRRS